MNRPLMVGTAVALVVVVLVGIWFYSAGSDSALLRPDDSVTVARGKLVYAEACAACHGTNLEGEANWRQRKADGRLPAPPHDASGHTWHHPDEQLFRVTKFGPGAAAGGGYESDMPGFEGTLSDEEIVAALSYIKSRWPAEVQARHDEINRQAGH